MLEQRYNSNSDSIFNSISTFDVRRSTFETKQNKTKQNKTKQNKTKQNKTYRNEFPKVFGDGSPHGSVQCLSIVAALSSIGEVRGRVLAQREGGRYQKKSPQSISIQKIQIRSSIVKTKKKKQEKR
jgi:hypothetical protein